MELQRQINRKGRRGSLTVEFAIASSLLLMLMVGAGDFARVFYYAVGVASASGNGAFWSAQSPVHSVRSTESESLAGHDADDPYGNATADTTLFCDCPDGSDPTPNNCYEGLCAGYGFPRLYVRTEVQQSFSVFLPWPGIPDPLVVNRETIMRVQ